MIRFLRILYMKMTSTSIPWAGSRRYVRIFYAIWSKIYDWTISWDPAFKKNAADTVRRTVKGGDRVLDVGVGTAILAETGAIIAKEYVGLDYSKSMLAKAEAKIKRLRIKNVELHQGDARKLPFEDQSFDSVVSSFVLPHFASKEKPELLREMFRVLKSGGRLGLFLAQGEIAPLFSCYDELEEYLNQAGFIDIYIEDLDDIYRIAGGTKPQF